VRHKPGVVNDEKEATFLMTTKWFAFGGNRIEVRGAISYNFEAEFTPKLA
jgi:hypothetical protein